MNRYTFKATGTVAVNLSIKADYVYFRSATLSGGAVDDTIILQSAGGGESMVLQPGQGCPFDQNVRDWVIYNAGGVGNIDGMLLFGKGPFTDNRPAGKTEVLGTVKTQETGMQYGAGVASMTPLVLGKTDFILPAANVNGVITHQSMMLGISAAGTATSTMLAKAGAAPAHAVDGEVLNYCLQTPTQQQPTVIQTPVFVAAGKGVYFFTSTAESSGMRSVLYTIL